MIRPPLLIALPVEPGVDVRPAPPQILTYANGWRRVLAGGAPGVQRLFGDAEVRGDLRSTGEGRTARRVRLLVGDLGRSAGDFARLERLTATHGGPPTAAARKPDGLA